jgi:hypothetical protein
MPALQNTSLQLQICVELGETIRTADFTDSNPLFLESLGQPYHLAVSACRWRAEGE